MGWPMGHPREVYPERDTHSDNSIGYCLSLRQPVAQAVHVPSLWPSTQRVAGLPAARGHWPLGRLSDLLVSKNTKCYTKRQT